MAYNTNLSLANITNNLSATEGYAYLSYDITHGFRLLVPVVNDNVTFFRDIDITDSGSDGVVDSANATVVVRGSTLYKKTGTIPTDRSIFLVGTQWVTVDSYVDADTITVDRSISDITITNVTEASTAVFTTNEDHGLSVNDPVEIVSTWNNDGQAYPLGDGTADSGIKANTTYYIGTVPSSDTFTLSSTTSNANPIEVTVAGSARLKVAPVYDLFGLLYVSDTENAAIVGKINKSGSDYTFEQYYSVQNQNNVPIRIVTSLPASGTFIGETVLLSSDNRIYVWDNTNWVSSDSYSVVLTNDSHVLPRTAGGTVTYTGSGTTISVFKGTTELDSVASNPGLGEFAVTPTGTNITPGAVNVTGTPAVIADHSGASASPSSVSYELDVEGLVTITRIQSLSFATEGADGAAGATGPAGPTGPAGSDGTDAKTIKLTASQYAVLYDGTGTKTPVAILLTGAAINFSSPQYRFLENGVERQTWSTTSTYTIPDAQEPAANTADSWTVEVREGSSGTYDAFDTISIYGVQDGTDGTNGVDGTDGLDAYTVILTNEAHTLSTTNTGIVTYTGSGTSITVYKGSTELNSVSGTPTTGQFSVSAVGSSITPGSITVTGNPAVVADHSSMTADRATVTYTINLEGTSTQVTKIQSLSKSIEGADGADGADGDTGPTGPAGTNGTDGDDGKQVASGQVYYQLSSASAPSTPSATSYTFATGAFSGLTTNWSTSPPTFEAGNSNKYWFSTFTVQETTAGGGTGTPSFTASSQGFGFSGLVTFSGSNLSDGTSTYNPATVINAGVTTIDGDQITTGSILATKMNVGNLSAISASLGTITAGTIQSGTSGERLVIKQDVITVYDSSNTVRLKIGDLS